MNKRTGIFLAACWVTLALSGVVLRAQDTSRVPDTNPDAASAVDASAHADVGGDTKLPPQPPAPLNKRSATYSKWGFPSANQSPATQFRPAQPTSGLAGPTAEQNLSTFGGPSGRTNSTIAPATGAKSAKPDRQWKPDWRSDPFGVPGAKSRHDLSTGHQLLETQLQPLSAQPQPSGFSSPFHGNEFVGLGTSSFPNPFPKTTHSFSQDQAKAKPHKSRALKSGEKVHADAGTVLPGEQGKKVRSPLTTKPE